MKRTIFFIFLFTLFSNVIVSATDTPISPNPPIIPPPYPRSCKQNETIVTVTLNDNEIVLNFNAAVGSAIIIVTDETGFPVYQGIMNTNLSSELYIPSNSWDSGNYILTIEYGSEILISNFTI